MPTYKVFYTFDGWGKVLIDAGSPEEAEQKYFDGEYDPGSEIESGQNYETDSIEELEEVIF